MADPVDAAMEQLQPPAPDGAVDGLRTEAEREELSAGDDPVLGGREAGDFVVWGELTSHSDVKSPRGVIRPPQIRSSSVMPGSLTSWALT